MQASRWSSKNLVSTFKIPKVLYQIFCSQLNHKFKVSATKKDLIKMCYEPFRRKFDLWCDKMFNMNPTYKE